MTVPTNPDSREVNWQKKFLAVENQWQDMKKNSEPLIVAAFLLAIAILYTSGYVADQFDRWLFETPSQFFFYLLLLRMLLIVLVPVFLLFVGFRFILKQARELIINLYQPKADEKISALILGRLWGIPPLPPPLNTLVKYPVILITKPELDDQHRARWLGGPATLIILEGFAVYLERGNKFSRVVGSNVPPPFLERYERIKEVVDLRPQNRKGYVEPWTKDGIRIKLHLNIEIQIDTGARALDEDSPNIGYPFAPLAVKAAVEYTSVRLIEDRLEEQSWLDGAWGSISGAINSFVAGHSLDELFVAPQTNNHANANHLDYDGTSENIEQIFSKAISERVTGETRNRLHNYGIHVLNIQITQVEIPLEILALRTKFWESTRNKIAALRNSRAEAEWIRVREHAHAEAQHTMLMTIINRLENVPTDQLTDSLALSLSGILDQGLDDPIVRSLLAKESFAILERIRKFLHESF